LFFFYPKLFLPSLCKLRITSTDILAVWECSFIIFQFWLLDLIVKIHREWGKNSTMSFSLTAFSINISFYGALSFSFCIDSLKSYFNPSPLPLLSSSRRNVVTSRNKDLSGSPVRIFCSLE
jgi:hypothetical protein